MQSLRRSGGCGNHGNCRGPRAAQILVRQVQQFLIVGVGVNRGHGAVNDAEGVLHYFGDRGQTIRGAGSIRDDVVLGRVVGLLIHAKH